jgi:hypothetical protein
MNNAQHSIVIMTKLCFNTVKTNSSSKISVHFSLFRILRQLPKRRVPVFKCVSDNEQCPTQHWYNGVTVLEYSKNQFKHSSFYLPFHSFEYHANSRNVEYRYLSVPQTMNNVRQHWYNDKTVL